MPLSGRGAQRCLVSITEGLSQTPGRAAPSSPGSWVWIKNMYASWDFPPTILSRKLQIQGTVAPAPPQSHEELVRPVLLHVCLPLVNLLTCGYISKLQTSVPGSQMLPPAGQVCRPRSCGQRVILCHAPSRRRPCPRLAPPAMPVRTDPIPEPRLTLRRPLHTAQCVSHASAEVSMVPVDS